VVAPEHKLRVPVIVGVGLTVKLIVLLQPPVIAYVILTVPPATPVTWPFVPPLLLMLAIVGSLLLQLPPLGEPTSAVVTLPAHTEVAPVIVGNAFTVTVPVVPEQPFASVKVNVTVPAETPVAMFPATVALAGALLTHVPPVEGVKVSVAPTHNVVAVDGVTTGFAFTVTADVVFLHPVLVWVNVNVTLPAATPVTTPAFVTVANAVLLLAHVPPVVGVGIIVLPAHIDDAGALTVGRGFTVTFVVPAALVQPFTVTVTEYAPASPAATDAILGFWADEVNPPGPVHEYVAPATLGVVKFNAAPTQRGPLLAAVGVAGFAFTTTDVVPAALVHPFTVIVTE
jgi:hypothetical protein